MARGTRLTKTAVDDFQAGGSIPAYLWDSKIPGFGVKALPSGKKRYLFKYRSGGGRRGTQRWLLLGGHGAVTVDEARKLAQQAAAAVARGEDPQTARQALRNRPAVVELWQRFETDYLPLRKAGTQRDYRRYWESFIRRAFAGKAVSDVTRADVDRLHKGMSSTPYEANRVLALLSRLMSLAEAWGMREQGTNPCRYVQRYKEQPRARYLSAAELTAIGQSLTSLVKGGDIRPDAANAIRLLLYTGARLNELLTAKWVWVDSNRRTIELPDSKTGKKLLYLSDAAANVLAEQQARADEKESEYVFPGRSKGKHMINLRKSWVQVCEKAKVTGVRLHDLRHTAASIAVGQGVSLPIIGRLLGHSQAQTTLRYAHVDNDPALEAANLVGKALEGKI